MGAGKPQFADGGGVDRAGAGRAIDHQRDVDGEFAVAAQKLAGAVERIDQDHGAAGVGNLSARCGFLGQHGDAGHLEGETVQNDRLGLLVGLADRAGIRFDAVGAALAIDFHHGQPGLHGEGGEDFRYPVEIEDRLGRFVCRIIGEGHGIHGSINERHECFKNGAVSSPPRSRSP